MSIRPLRTASLRAASLRAAPLRAALAGMLLTAVALPLAVLPAAAAEPAPMDKAAVEKIVREYILQNPEIITEAITVLQQREEEAAARAVSETVRANQKELTRSSGSPVVGNPEGDVTLVEFFDYQCGYCKRAHPQRVAAVADDGMVRVVLKEFPILGPASVEASKAALAAAKQGKYEPMHEALLAHQGPLSSEVIKEIAGKVGLDLAQLEKDMASPDIQAEIDANYKLAQALNIRGTPGFIVGETVVPGMIGRDAFTQLFQAERAAKKGG